LYLIISAVVGRFEIQQISMEPTFHEGQRVVISHWDRLLASFRTGVAQAAGEQTAATAYTRGQVVVLYPDPAHAGIPLIKRVIGTPGDTLTLESNLVAVNGAPLVEPYVYGAPTSCMQYCGTVTLEAGQYFVMGDNRTQSYDSRYFGPVNEQDIIGHVLLRYWPLNALAVYP
jgi:signal peptidase I